MAVRHAGVRRNDCLFGDVVAPAEARWMLCCGCSRDTGRKVHICDATCDAILTQIDAVKFRDCEKMAEMASICVKMHRSWHRNRLFSPGVLHAAERDDVEIAEKLLSLAAEVHHVT